MVTDGPSNGTGNHAAGEYDTTLDSLSRQELAVLQELALGASDAQVAEHLHLAERTVTHRVGSIIEKLRLVDRPAAVRLAREKGLRAT